MMATFGGNLAPMKKNDTPGSDPLYLLRQQQPIPTSPPSCPVCRRSEVDFCPDPFCRWWPTEDDE